MFESFNHEVLLIFLGGLLTLFLTVILVFGKQAFKRELERGRLKANYKSDPDASNKIEAKLDDSYEFRKLNFIELLAEHGLQPLCIISFISFFYPSRTLETFFAVAVVFFTILHELWSGKRYSGSFWYQLLLGVCWLSLFALISFNANEFEKSKANPANNETGKGGVVH
jgi:hypothetical protein